LCVNASETKASSTSSMDTSAPREPDCAAHRGGRVSTMRRAPRHTAESMAHGMPTRRRARRAPAAATCRQHRLAVIHDEHHQNRVVRDRCPARRNTQAATTCGPHTCIPARSRRRTHLKPATHSFSFRDATMPQKSMPVTTTTRCAVGCAMDANSTAPFVSATTTLRRTGITWHASPNAIYNAPHKQTQTRTPTHTHAHTHTYTHTHTNTHTHTHTAADRTGARHACACAAHAARQQASPTHRRRHRILEGTGAASVSTAYSRSPSARAISAPRGHDASEGSSTTWISWRARARCRTLVVVVQCTRTRTTPARTLSAYPPRCCFSVTRRALASLASAAASAAVRRRLGAPPTGSSCCTPPPPPAAAAAADCAPPAAATAAAAMPLRHAGAAAAAAAAAAAGAAAPAFARGRGGGGAAAPKE
jgi:hypothetical protein